MKISLIEETQKKIEVEKTKYYYCNRIKNKELRDQKDTIFFLNLVIKFILLVTYTINLDSFYEMVVLIILPLFVLLWSKEMTMDDIMKNWPTILLFGELNRIIHIICISYLRNHYIYPIGLIFNMSLLKTYHSKVYDTGKIIVYYVNTFYKKIMLLFSSSSHRCDNNKEVLTTQ